MNKHKGKKPVLFILLFAGFVLLIFLLMQPIQVRYGGAVSLLAPKGAIALKQRNLLFIIQAIMLLVVIPVYILTFIFSWKYRAHNPKAKYTPDWDDNRLAEYIWWGVPCVLVIIIGIFTWVKTYHLDPFKPIPSEKKPLKVQVVALQWKWLFIYPEEKIAIVNFLQIPEKTPIAFEITADAPMNSFWIPQLGGQIYAMPKMRTKLHLIADQIGEFRGSSANLSGDEFASMYFRVKSTSEEDFKKWVTIAKESPNLLTSEEYELLAKPKGYYPVTIYQLKEEDLFNEIIMKYEPIPKVSER
jgi:cytochrome o ubiquinol oxidase subunit 2